MRITGKYYTVVIMTSFLSNSHYLTVNGPFSDTKLFDNEDVSKGREVSGWGGGGGGGGVWHVGWGCQNLHLPITFKPTLPPFLLTLPFENFGTAKC